MSAKKKTLILDNFDSFTYNLFQQCSIEGGNPEVYLNNEISLREIRKKNFTHIILSAGPGTVEKPGDFGICADVIAELSGILPILGVCLGHQGIVFGFQGKIERAPLPVHGKKKTVKVDQGSPLFQGMPEQIEVMRYHSLVASKKNFPPELEIIAESLDDGTIMAVAHRTWPLFGVQFHPESIGTPLGHLMMKNFLFCNI